MAAREAKDFKDGKLESTLYNFYNCLVWFGFFFYFASEVVEATAGSIAASFASFINCLFYEYTCKHSIISNLMNNTVNVKMITIGG